MSQLRKIRSYVQRGRKFSARQGQLWQDAVLQGVLTNYFVDESPCWLQSKCKGPLALEIGFGNGDALLQQAKARPDVHFFGIEVYREGILKALTEIKQQSLSNIQLIYGDAELVLPSLPENCFERVNIFFPDPWPKSRHHKRRLVNYNFLQMLVTKMRVGGILHFATDWQEYAAVVLQSLAKIDNMQNLYLAYAPASMWVKTKFFTKGDLAGRGCYELIFDKVK